MMTTERSCADQPAALPDEGRCYLYAPLREMLQLGSRLQARLASCGAARVGETAVVSRQVHIVDPREPDVVQVLLSADAGQTFYHRRQAGEIIHIDVFHAVAAVDHRAVARRLREHVGAVLRDFFPSVAPGMLDYIDLQTGTGGGRITGSLTFGQRESLRQVHSNHVHIAARLPAGLEGLVLVIVDGVERELLAQGVEPRAVARLVLLTAARQGKGTELDLSPYTSRTDSLLKEQPVAGEPGSREPEPGADPVPEPASGLLADAVRLADDLLSLHDAWELLQDLETGLPLREIRRRRAPEAAERALQWLRTRGLVRGDRTQLVLTPRGQRLLTYFARHLREIELALKKELRRLRPTQRGSLLAAWKILQAEWRGQSCKTSQPLEPGQWIGELVLTDSVVAAAVSSLRRGPTRGGAYRLQLTRQDLRVAQRRRRRGLDICLLIDASASMAGERLRAAKYLAQHLLFATRDRVAVFTFQERRCDLRCRFTRNYALVERGLRAIEPFGLTPLAEGLYTALEYLQRSRQRDPLLLLITDGIPTVPRTTLNPLEDALTAADRLREARIPLACIGLQPNQKYLQELVDRAGGSLYVVEELERDLLIAIAHQERERQQRG